MILYDDGKKEFLNNNFHQYFDIKLSSNITPEQSIQTINVTLPLSKIDETYDLEAMRKYFNEEYNNVIFTSSDDNNIHRYEFYNGIYFIKMNSYNEILRMHIIPKKYDASDSKTANSILFFKDNKQEINNTIFSKDNHYNRNDKPVINSQYLEEEKQTSNAQYKFNIKKYTRNMNNLQINMGYSYNNTTPTDHRKHYTGIIDESDENGNTINEGGFTEFNAALMDANYDLISDYTNIVKKQRILPDGLRWELDNNPYSDGESTPTGFNNTHELNHTYHKIIKYFNDDIYIEENGLFLTQMWREDG